MKELFGIFKSYKFYIQGTQFLHYYCDEDVVSYNIGNDYWVHIWLLPSKEKDMFPEDLYISIGKYKDYTDEENYEMENKYIQFICKSQKINCKLVEDNDKSPCLISEIYIIDTIVESLQFINNMISEFYNNRTDREKYYE